MHDYDPCDHGMDSDCCACDIAQLERQAEADEQEIILLQQLLRGVYLGHPDPVRDAQKYLKARALI